MEVNDRKCVEKRIHKLRANVSNTSRPSIAAEVSASIVHEINQPLNSILMNAQACARWLKAIPPAIEEAAASVDSIARDVRAIDAVMNNVRLLFNRQPVVKLPYSMADIIQDAISIIRASANLKLIPLEFDFGDLVPLVIADRFQIQQVIINLIGNAMEAMEGSDRTPSLHICIKRMGDRQVLTEFIDNGCGLPVHMAESIFDAFVTTKKNGMGVGLSISRSIVEAHGGQLWAQNNLGYGAKFSLLLSGSEPTMGSNQPPLVRE